MQTRPATIEEMKVERPEGSKVSFEHAIYETARIQRGRFVTVQRSRTTARIRYDEKGPFVMRKDQREDLKATYCVVEGCRPFVACFRATYLS